MLSEESLQILGESTIAEATLPELVGFAKRANLAYRAGEPIIKDCVYDLITAEIAKRDPENEFINEVEPEPELIAGKTVPLPKRMLSTRKIYSMKELEKWCDDVIAVGLELGIPDDSTMFRITPKLDGYAAFNTGTQLITRGSDGRNGTDISRVAKRGLQGTGLNSTYGKGEIVVDRMYFESELSGEFENSRNVIAAAIKEGELDDAIADGIRMGCIRFEPFTKLSGWRRNKDGLLSDLDDMWSTNVATCVYDTDGLVIEAVPEVIKNSMGSTNHHHRWQIAYKRNTEYADVRVKSITWQTAKTGRITPVAELEPTRISGAEISRATCHHMYAAVTNGIDAGAIVRVCRSGQVIPYIESVVRKAEQVKVPEKCPSCGSNTETLGDYLVCTNTATCPAQIERTIEHFFRTIGNCDGFGSNTVKTLVLNGFKTVSGIYRMSLNDFMVVCEVGDKTSWNLFEGLGASTQLPLEDWRFLAAFALPGMGVGNCERLLKKYRIETIFDLTAEDIIAIEGFAHKTATQLVESLVKIREDFEWLRPRFNLIRTPIAGEESVDSPIAGKTIVFTGTMTSGSRDDMKAKAKSLGAKVTDSVTGKTDYLVCGTNVGASKTASAAKNNVQVLTEDEYLNLIGEK